MRELVSDLPQSGNLTLLYAGRFDAEEKRVMDLPPILSALKERKIDFMLRLAGTGPAETELRAKLAIFGDQVEFVGVLSEAQLRDSFFLPGAILLVLSPTETGPMVAWEAMAAGVALVTSRFIGIGLEASLIDGQTCISFPVGNIEAAVTGIALLQNHSARQRIIREGWATVAARYTRTRSIAAWNGALLDVLRLPGRPSCQRAFSSSAPGRLDGIIGRSMAETMRALIGIGYPHSEPGGEWPHAYGHPTDVELERRLAQLDLQ